MAEGAVVAPIALRRARAMLAYLALKEPHRESRETLVDLLWPDRFKLQAQASLRQVLFELRAAAGDAPPIIEASRSQVALGAAIVGCDVWELEALAGPCGDLGGLDRAEEMLRLYRGGLLGGMSIGVEPFQQWLAIQRAHLEGLLEDAILGASATIAADTADGERAVRALQRLIALSPMCCQAVARLIEIEAARDRRPDALRHYERYARRLRREFDEAPPPELHDAYEALRSQPPPVMARTMAPAIRRPAFVHRDPWRRTRGDAPVLAVLPFRYEGTRDDGMAQASALSEDITMMLSGCRWFSVLSRSATHPLSSDAGFVPREFARRTGVDYLVYGAVTDRGGRPSLAIELAEAEMGGIRWAKRYEAADGDQPSWASEICSQIVAELDPAVVASERATLRRSPIAATGSSAAYRHLVLGYHHFYAGDWGAAAGDFRAAIREDGGYAHAHAMLAMAIYLSAQLDRDDRWASLLVEAEASARRAIEIDPSDAKACNILGQTLDWQGRHDEASGFLEQTLTLNPGFALASTARSYHAVMTGAYDAAKTFIQTAMRLRVGDAGLGLCLPSKALADLHLGNHRDALQTAHWAARLRPRFWLTRQTLAACLSAGGDVESASATIAGLRRDYPGLTAAAFTAWFPYADAAMGEPVRQALERAGWR